MDRSSEQPGRQGTDPAQRPTPGPSQQDLSQSDFSRSDQGTGTSESHSGEPWTPAASDAPDASHPQTVQAKPSAPASSTARTPEAESAAAARNDSETGGR